MSQLVINIPGEARVDAIERVFYEQFNSFDGQIKEVILDFRSVWFIEPSTSTTYIIAMLYMCKEKGYSFKIIPPGNNGVKIILYTWRFFEVLEEVTSCKISEFAPTLENDFKKGKSINVRLSSAINRNLKYYTDVDSLDIQGYFKKKYLGQDGICFLTLNEKFFPLLSLNFDSPESKQQEFLNEKIRWRNAELINRILSNNLTNLEIKDEIADNVICETISNAIIHSTACKFFTGSYFQFTEPNANKDTTYHFTINFWDSGKSIIETLKLPLINKKSIISVKTKNDFLSKHNEIEFFIKYEDKKYIEESFKSSFSELDPDDDERILLAAFFPGVSCSPYREPDIFNQIPAGIGLSYLTNTVVKNLKGEIAIRTKKYFLNIRQLTGYDKDQYIAQRKTTDTKKPKRKEIFSDKTTYYSAKFQIFNNQMPEFIGNMITIRIPLKYR